MLGLGSWLPREPKDLERREGGILQLPGKVGSSCWLCIILVSSGFHRLEDLKPTKKDPTWSESADRWIIASLQWPNQSLLKTRFELIFTSLISWTYPPKVLQEITAPLIILSVLQLPYQAYQAVPSFQVLPFVSHHLPIFSAPENGADHHRVMPSLPSLPAVFVRRLGMFLLHGIKRDRTRGMSGHRAPQRDWIHIILPRLLL